MTSIDSEHLLKVHQYSFLFLSHKILDIFCYCYRKINIVLCKYMHLKNVLIKFKKIIQKLLMKIMLLYDPVNATYNCSRTHCNHASSKPSYQPR